MPPTPRTCIDCGAPIARRTATRCRRCANRVLNAAKPGTFTPESARAAVEARTAKHRAEREELAELRARLKESTP